MMIGVPNQPTFEDTWGALTRRGPGRPRVTEDEKARRGTLRADRSLARTDGPAAIEVPARDYPAIAVMYAADILAGRVVACKWVRLAMLRDAADRAAWTDEGPYAWDPAHGAAACHFLEQLPHVEGAWTTATVHLEPFQIWFLMTLYGWRQRAAPDRRRFTSVYLETGRKSAKSTLMAGLLLYHVLREDEPGARGVCGASTGPQARIVFEIAQRMVRRSLWLREQGIEAFQHSIFTPDAVIKPINAKASTQDGLNPSCIVLDEAHAQTFALHDVLKSAQGARKNPLLLCPTTAGYNLLSVGYALRTTVLKILERVVTVDHVLGLVYGLDEGDDWRDERVWIKANPMIGVTPTYDFVRRYCEDAKATPGLEAEFRIKVCSEWANAASSWLSLTAWDACADPALRLEQFAGEPCWIGGDLAQLDDLAAIAYVFVRGETLYAFVQFYLPELTVASRARAIPDYLVWAKSGLLTLTPGNMIDYATIERDLRAACRRFDVRALVFDQFGSVQLTGALSNDGLPARVEPKNAKTMTLPARELEARVKAAQFRHDGNSCLRWQASNVVVTRRTDDTLLPKKDSAESSNKIDGIDALLEGIGAYLAELAKGTPAYQLVIL
jgi:phage terminase large subunit-like protein